MDSGGDVVSPTLTLGLGRGRRLVPSLLRSQKLEGPSKSNSLTHPFSSAMTAPAMGAARGPPSSGGAASSEVGKGQRPRSSIDAEDTLLATLLNSGLCAPEVELGALWFARQQVRSQSDFPQHSAESPLTAAQEPHRARMPAAEQFVAGRAATLLRAWLFSLRRPLSWDGRTSSPLSTGALLRTAYEHPSFAAFGFGSC